MLTLCLMNDAELRELAEALNSGAIHLLRAVSAVDHASGLTAARLSALSVLVYGGPRTLSGLARAEGVTAPTMTRIVDGLVELGLATRRPHPDSARLVRVAATDRGRQRMNRARERRVDVLVAALSPLSAAEQRCLGAAVPVLDCVAERLAASSRTSQPRSGRRR